MSGPLCCATIIYGIFDVEDGLARYVGQTCNLKARMAQHKSAKTKIGDWLRVSHDRSEVRILEQARFLGWKTEKRWIERLWREGHPLLNKYGVPCDERIIA